MATLISSHNGEHCTGKCDANCHDAKHPDCNCICGGMNHGVGLQKAQDNTREFAEEWIKKWERDHPGEKVKTNPEEVEQLKLF